MSRRSVIQQNPDAWKEGTRLSWALGEEQPKTPEPERNYQCPNCGTWFVKRAQAAGHKGWCMGGHQSRRKKPVE
jgi:hypothetical protein